MNFAALFRKSAFARYDPKIPTVFSRSKFPKIFPNAPLQFEDAPHEPLFGVKCEPPKKYFGKGIEHVSFNSLDQDFSLPEFVDAKDRVLQRQIFDHLNALLTSDSSKIPGRVLESCEGGFLIGIGPVKAHLPQSEIPAGVNFNFYDMLDRKAYYFHLKSVQSVISSEKSALKLRQVSGTDILSDSHSSSSTSINPQQHQKHGYNNNNNNHNNNYPQNNSNNNNNNKKLLYYNKYAQEQGFKVILTLRK